MKKTTLLLTTLLIANKLQSMELPPTFTPEGKPMAKPSLYLDEKAKDEFHEKIKTIIQCSLSDKESDQSLFNVLIKYTKEHAADAEMYWEANQYAVIGLAKGKRDAAKKFFSEAEIIRTNIMIGYLKDFKAGIVRAKQLQALRIQASQKNN